MRHPRKPICTFRIATKDDIRGPRSISLIKARAPLLLGYLPTGQWKNLQNGNTTGRVRPRAKFRTNTVYAVEKYNQGSKLSYKRWEERIIARLNRCPEESIIALHSGLVNSLEL